MFSPDILEEETLAEEVPIIEEKLPLTLEDKISSIKKCKTKLLATELDIAEMENLIRSCKEGHIEEDVCKELIEEYKEDIKSRWNVEINL